MSRIEEIKEEQALNHCFLNYAQVEEHYKTGVISQNSYDDWQDDVIKAYTEECIKASLEKASKRVFLIDLSLNQNVRRYIYDESENLIEINKEEITDPENIVLL